MYLNLTVADFFKSFDKPARISQFLAEGFATNNCFLVGAATEELIDRGEEAVIAVIVRGAATGGRFNANSPAACIFSEALANAGNDFPILQAILRAMPKSSDDRLWVERAVASAASPSKGFNDDQELVQWFQDWLKDDECFNNFQAPGSDVGPTIREDIDTEN